MSSPNGSEPDVAFHNALMDQVHFWWNVVLIPLGVVGNVLCLLVVGQKQHRAVSCSVYIGALAVCDAMTLAANGVYLWMRFGMENVSLETLSALCRGVLFVKTASNQSGIVLILALLLERVVVVARPMKALILSTPRRAALISIVCIVLSFLFKSPPTMSMVAKRTAGSADCYSIPGSFIRSEAYRWLNFIFGGTFPLCAVLVMNLVILYYVKKSPMKVFRAKHRKHRKKSPTSQQQTENFSLSKSVMETGLSTDGVDIMVNEPNLNKQLKCGKAERKDDPAESKEAISSHHNWKIAQGNSDKDSKKDWTDPSSQDQHPEQQKGNQKWERKTVQLEKQLTRMTIVMTLTFAVCVLPSNFCFLIKHMLAVSSPQAKIAVRWLCIVGRNLKRLNNAINFLIYVMTGSRFRAAFVTMLRRIRIRLRVLLPFAESD